MVALPGPFEILELAPGEVRALTVLKAEVGEMTIQPRDGRPAKTIVAIRLHVPEADKPLFPHYWDATSQTLRAQLEPLVARVGYRPTRFRITKVGAGAAARFQVNVLPAEVPSGS